MTGHTTVVEFLAMRSNSGSSQPKAKINGKQNGKETKAKPSIIDERIVCETMYKYKRKTHIMSGNVQCNLSLLCTEKMFIVI